MVNVVTSYNSRASALQPVPPVAPRPRPEDLFNALDTGSKGYLTQADVQSAIVRISDQGKKLSAADAQTEAKAIFSRIDANGDGKATLAEFKQAAPDGPPAGGPPGDTAQATAKGGEPAEKGGKPRGGGGGGGGAGGGGGGAAKPDTSYDPADTNKDGVVSELERLAYSVKHLSTSTQAALKAYESASKTTSTAAA